MDPLLRRLSTPPPGPFRPEFWRSPLRGPWLTSFLGTLLLLVGGSLFEFGTGVLNIQVFYPWHFNFVREHYYGAWVFVAALTAHVVVKLPTVVRAYREQGFLRPLHHDLPHTRPEPADA